MAPNCQHIRGHMETKTDVVECIQCGKSVKARRLTQHMKIHSSIRPFKCTACSKTFYKKSHLMRHMRVHSGEKRFVCSECGKAYAQKSQLLDHNREHTQGFLRCSHCPMVFKRKQNLQYHLITHTGVSDFMCSFCQYTTQNAGALERHLVSHTKEKAFQCDKCPKRFGIKSNLTRHRKRHLSENEVQCAFCDHETCDKNEMDDHIRRHVGEKAFQCPHCPHATVTKWELNCHLKKHKVGTRTFDCDICSKRLASRVTLVDHKRLHSGHIEQCKFCQKRFTNVYKMNHHVKTQHPTVTDTAIGILKFANASVDDTTMLGNRQKSFMETREIRIYLTRIDA